MTIYVAICDDNIADRKQTERLLEREKDARLKSNSDVLYIDSFGSEEALLHTPVKYDIFFIDITNSSNNGMEIAKILRKRGIVAPIVLCASTIDYTLYANNPSDLSIISKPISAGQISHFIDLALSYTSSKIPLMEIRSSTETHFIRYVDIIKASPMAKFLTQITLTDGSIINMMDSIDSFYRMCRSYNCFVICGKDIINVMHITGSLRNGFELSNGEKAHYYFYQKKALLESIGDSIPTAIH